MVQFAREHDSLQDTNITVCKAQIW